MNEVVKRRLAGAIVLIGIAFVGVSLLPRIGSAPGEDGVRIVVIDLGAPDSPAPVAAVAAVPPQLAAPASALQAQPDDSADDAEESADIADPGAANPADSAPSQTQDLAAATAEPLATAELPSPAPLRPSLKLSEMPPPAARTTPPPLPTQPASVSSPGSRWFVQVGGFADIRNAHQAQDRLRGVGQASIIAPSESDRGTLYRVRAGPYASREAAVAAQAQLAGAGFAASTIVE